MSFELRTSNVSVDPNNPDMVSLTVNELVLKPTSLSHLAEITSSMNLAGVLSEGCSVVVEGPQGESIKPYQDWILAKIHTDKELLRTKFRSRAAEWLKANRPGWSSEDIEDYLTMHTDLSGPATEDAQCV